MANRFTDSFNQPYMGMPQQNPDIFTQFNSFKQDPYSALASRGINVPEQYRGSYQQAAQYLMQNMPQTGKNNIFQRVNMLRSMFGMR